MMNGEPVHILGMRADSISRFHNCKVAGIGRLAEHTGKQENDRHIPGLLQKLGYFLSWTGKFRYLNFWQMILTALASQQNRCSCWIENDQPVGILFGDFHRLSLRYRRGLHR